MTQPEVAALIGCCHTTLAKYFSNELARAVQSAGVICRRQVDSDQGEEADYEIAAMLREPGRPNVAYMVNTR